jgi:DNA-directed RNA polymerase specialized sigma24 family protein
MAGDRRSVHHRASSACCERSAATGDLAEEITQMTFCRIAAKIGSYSEAGKFEAWLFRIAMNILRDEMRRRQRHAMPTENQALIGSGGGGNAGARCAPMRRNSLPCAMPSVSSPMRSSR